MIDSEAGTCISADLNSINNPLADDPNSQLLLRPYDLLQFNGANLTYIGKKHCRGMHCHFWSGRKNLAVKGLKGESTYGIFGYWATTSKWTQNFSSADPAMDKFLVAIDMQLRSSIDVIIDFPSIYFDFIFYRFLV